MPQERTPLQNVNIVLTHGAWGDGSGWAKVIAPLSADGYQVTAAPLPLTSYADDVAALQRALDRVTGLLVLVGHAYAGAVISGVRGEKVKALVYVAALAPDEGETVADMFYRGPAHPQAPQLSPHGEASSTTPATPLAQPMRRMPRPTNWRCSPPCSGQSRQPASPCRFPARSGRSARPGS